MTLADRQSASSRQGREFEEAVVTLLKIAGWAVVDRKWRQPDIDVEIDIVAVDPDGVTWWIECKGSYDDPKRAGIKRTDSMLKAIGAGALIRLLPDRERYMVVTSHLPVSGAAFKWYEAALDQYVDRFWVVGMGS